MGASHEGWYRLRNSSHYFCLTEMSYFLYILECADTTLYVGSTNDLKKRLREHNHMKKGAHYTKIRRPVVLKYKESFATLKEARQREIEIKRLTRKKKLELMRKK